MPLALRLNDYEETSPVLMTPADPVPGLLPNHWYGCRGQVTGNEMPGVARLALQRAYLHWIDIDLQMASCDERIASHVRSDERARKAATLLVVGPTTASAVVASVSDFGQFANARQFGAWLGLVPSQDSSPAERFVSGASVNRTDTSPPVDVQSAPRW